MSIQPIPSNQRAPDASASRRRTESGPGEAFALPEQGGVAVDGEKGAPGKAAAAAAAAETAAIAPKSASAKDGGAAKPGDVAAKPPGPKPAGNQADAAAADSSDFLVAVAAAQAEGAAAQAGEDKAPAGGKPKAGGTEAAEEGEADGTGEPQGADQAKAGAAHPSFVAVLPLPIPAPAIGTGDTAPAAKDTALAVGEAVKGRALPAALAGFAKSEATAETAEAGEANASAAGKLLPEAGQLGEGKAASEKPAVAASLKTDGAAAAEPKQLDSLQQALGPLDLSAMLQQATGKPGHDRLVQPFDPNALANGAPGAQTPGAQTGQPTPIHVVPIEIGLKAMSGTKQFDIRLDPDELGRVDVNLSISDSGEVSARLVVDRVETLHLLQRDARTLERAFEQAGLKPSDAGVDISLRDPADQSFRQNRQHEEAPQRPRLPQGSERADDTSLSTDPAPQRRIVRLGGVDLSI